MRINYAAWQGDIKMFLEIIATSQSLTKLQIVIIIEKYYK